MHRGPGALDAFEVRKEGLIEGVELALGVHQERPGDVVEAIQRGVVQARLERLGEGQGLLGPDGDPSAAKLVDKR